MNEARYRGYLLVVLLVILAFNNVDRLALGLLLHDMGRDLKLSDAQLGLLSGIAFSLFYALMGIPIARWADRGNRVTIIAVTTAVWGTALALCGLAGNFLQIVLIRVGVAVGKAGCMPPAHSLIADHFSRAERPQAMATYMLGTPLSVLPGYLLAGWLSELYGWRWTYLSFGPPSIALALLAWLTLREPRLGETSPEAAGLAAVRPQRGNRTQPALKEVRAVLWSNVTFRHLLSSYTVLVFFGQAIGQWQPAFFVRSYGLRTGELGTWLALAYGIGGVLGTYLGGAIATRHAAHNETLQLRITAVACAAFGAISVCIYVCSNPYIAFGLLGIAVLGVSIATAPLFATLQTLVPESMRAISIAVLNLVACLIGMGLGPLAAGILSDVLYPVLREESLRYALLILSFGYPWSGWHLWKGSETVASDLETRLGSSHAALTKNEPAL